MAATTDTVLENKQRLDIHELTITETATKTTSPLDQKIKIIADSVESYLFLDKSATGSLATLVNNLLEVMSSEIIAEVVNELSKDKETDEVRRWFITQVAKAAYLVETATGKLDKQAALTFVLSIQEYLATKDTAFLTHIVKHFNLTDAIKFQAYFNELPELFKKIRKGIAERLDSPRSKQRLAGALQMVDHQNLIEIQLTLVYNFFLNAFNQDRHIVMSSVHRLLTIISLKESLKTPVLLVDCQDLSDIEKIPFLFLHIARQDYAFKKYPFQCAYMLARAFGASLGFISMPVSSLPLRNKLQHNILLLLGALLKKQGETAFDHLLIGRNWQLLKLMGKVKHDEYLARNAKAKSTEALPNASKDPKIRDIHKDQDKDPKPFVPLNDYKELSEIKELSDVHVEQLFELCQKYSYQETLRTTEICQEFAVVKRARDINEIEKREAFLKFSYELIVKLDPKAGYLLNFKPSYSSLMVYFAEKFFALQKDRTRCLNILLVVCNHVNEDFPSLEARNDCHNRIDSLIVTLFKSGYNISDLSPIGQMSFLNYLNALDKRGKEQNLDNANVVFSADSPAVVSSMMNETSDRKDIVERASEVTEKLKETTDETEPTEAAVESQEEPDVSLLFQAISLNPGPKQPLSLSIIGNKPRT